MPPAATQQDTEQARDVCTSAYLYAAGTQKNPVGSRCGFSITNKCGRANRVVAPDGDRAARRRSAATGEAAVRAASVAIIPGPGTSDADEYGFRAAPCLSRRSAGARIGNGKSRFRL